MTEGCRNDGGVQAVRQGVGHARTDRVQVHIGHGRQQRLFIEQGLTLEAPLPKPAGAAVFGIGLAGNGFVEHVVSRRVGQRNKG